MVIGSGHVIHQQSTCVMNKSEGDIDFIERETTRH